MIQTKKKYQAPKIEEYEVDVCVMVVHHTPSKPPVIDFQSSGARQAEQAPQENIYSTEIGFGE
ncbi:MAG: hypothetical protein MJZ13_06200 [Bacteroidales bacterium]|nr:hypothetical protein [Bacteroidales bacterium]